MVLPWSVGSARTRWKSRSPVGPDSSFHHRWMQAFARALYHGRIGDRPVVLGNQAIVPLAGLNDSPERIRGRWDNADPEAAASSLLHQPLQRDVGEPRVGVAAANIRVGSAKP